MRARSFSLVEAETGRTVARLESPDSCDVRWATFSPDGSRLAVTTNELPAAVHVWDLRAIRKRLAAMGLDWETPAYPDDDPASPCGRPLPPLQTDLGPLARDLEHYIEATGDIGRALFRTNRRSNPTTPSHTTIAVMHQPDATICGGGR